MSALTRVLLIAAVFGFGLSPALAQEGEAPPEAEGDAPEGDAPEGDAPEGDAPDGEAPDGEQPIDPPTGQDIITLKTGEVIKGKIVNLSKDELTFESESMEKVTLPWNQVESIESGNTHEYETTDGERYLGIVEGTPERLRLKLADTGDERVINAGELNSINEERTTELDNWSAKIILGYSQTFGNTRQRTGTALASITRDDGTIRWVLEGISIYGQADGDEIAKAHRAFTQLDYNVTDRFYVTPFVGSIDYDRFANIDRRFRGGPGVGYWILKDEEFITWNVESGYAYTHVVYRRVNPGTKRTRSEHAVRAATRVNIELGDHITLRGFYETYIGTGDIQDTIHHVEASASFKYEWFSIDIGVIYDRQERTIRRPNDGNLPKRDDAKLVAGVGVAF